jgi:hypothetical protein
VTGPLGRRERISSTEAVAHRMILDRASDQVVSQTDVVARRLAENPDVSVLLIETNAGARVRR